MIESRLQGLFINNSSTLILDEVYECIHMFGFLFMISRDQGLGFTSIW